MKYYKILNEEEIHGDLHYKTGLNVDPVPFNDDPEASCLPGGIYFSDAENVMAFVNYGPWIREVTIPEGARMIKDPSIGPTKYRADKVILGERRKWSDVEVLKELVKEGINIHAGCDYALYWAVLCGRLETVQGLVEQGADIHDTFDLPLRTAAQHGHLGIVRYLTEQGADIRARDDWAMRWAAGDGHLAVVCYLVEHGADIHACKDEALCWAARNDHLEVVRYLVKKGADIHADGDMALYWAKENGHTEVIQYLELVIEKNP